MVSRLLAESGINTMREDINCTEFTVANVCIAKCIDILNKVFNCTIDWHNCLVVKRLDNSKFKETISSILSKENINIDPKNIDKNFDVDSNLEAFQCVAKQEIGKFDDIDEVYYGTKEVATKAISDCINIIKDIVRKNIASSAATPVATPVNEQPAQGVSALDTPATGTTDTQPLIRIMPNQTEARVNVFPLIQQYEERIIDEVAGNETVDPIQEAAKTFKEQMMAAVANQLLQNPECQRYTAIGKDTWGDKILNVPVFENNVLTAVEETKKVLGEDNQFCYALAGYQDENNFILKRLIEKGNETLLATEQDGGLFVQATIVNGHVSIRTNAKTSSVEEQFALMVSVFPNHATQITTNEDLQACMSLANRILNNKQLRQYKYNLCHSENGSYYAADINNPKSIVKLK